MQLQIKFIQLLHPKFQQLIKILKCIEKYWKKYLKVVQIINFTIITWGWEIVFSHMEEQ
jgi:hypothetical protein